MKPRSYKNLKLKLMKLLQKENVKKRSAKLNYELCATFKTYVVCYISLKSVRMSED